MEERIKYRLTGTVVVLALAIIFLPMLFDGAGVPDIPFDVDLPPPPMSAVEPLPEPGSETWAFVDEANDLRDRFERAPGLIGQPQHRATGLDEASSGADRQGVPLAWSVQLASFLRENNAVGLRDQLQQDGYNAYLVRIRDGEALRTQVAVGPRVSREEVEALQGELRERYELEGIIVRFHVAAR
ncbi:MAG: SPOR domain-containing protein [Pseudomonadales bacterium]